MTARTLIVTHPGSSHRDDFLTCCLLLGWLRQQGAAPTVERRVPLDSELLDPRVWVLDIGGKHEPRYLNFDHHQLPAEGIPECSLSLVLKHLDLFEKALEAFDWLEPSVFLDVRGPYQLAQRHHADLSIVPSLVGPVEEYLLKLFADQSRVEPGNPLHDIMLSMGRRILDDIQAFHERMHYLNERGRVMVTARGRRVFVLPPDRISDSLLAVEKQCRKLGNIVACIVPSDRGPGYSLRRLGDNTDIDFNGLQGDPRITFIHSSGFVAKTAPNVKDADLQDLLNKSEK